jgi:hydroxyacyl-ACP dehydratase HTD2-like protein with hotdog domain
MNESVKGASLGKMTFPVERGKVREFATAILDDNPLYLEEEMPPAPPTFTMTSQFWPATSDEPPPDLGINFARVVHGEQDFEYLEPIRAGDVLTGEITVADVYTKEGKRGGTLTFVVLETRFTNQLGKEAVVARATIIETSKAATSD